MNPNHTLAVHALHHLILLKNQAHLRAGGTAVSRSVRDSYPDATVAGWAMNYQLQQALNSGDYQTALALGQQIRTKFPRTLLARESLQQTWTLHHFFLQEPEKARDIIAQYEQQYGMDEELLFMKIEANLISKEEAEAIQVALMRGMAKPGTTPGRETPAQAAPATYSLSENYPNPFNPATTIRYGLPEQSSVTILIYDLSGRLVRELVNTDIDAGYHTVEFDGSTLPSGIYLYRMNVRSLESDKRFTKVGRMMLLK